MICLLCDSNVQIERSHCQYLYLVGYGGSQEMWAVMGWLGDENQSLCPLWLAPKRDTRHATLSKHSVPSASTA